MRKVQIDIIFLVILVLLQFLLIFMQIISPVRAAIGFMIIAFIPGYLLLKPLMDHSHNDAKFLHLLLLSVPVSLAITVLVGMIEFVIIPNQTNDEVQIVVLGNICIIIALFSLMKRKYMQEVRQTRLFFICVIAFLMIISIPNIAYSLSEQNHLALSFYVVDVDGQANDQSYTAKVDTPINIHLGGEYRGNDPLLVTIQSSTGQTKEVRIQPLSESYKITFTETFAKPGLYQVRWDLSDDQATNISRFVSVWITVE